MRTILMSLLVLGLTNSVNAEEFVCDGRDIAVKVPAGMDRLNLDLEMSIEGNGIGAGTNGSALFILTAISANGVKVASIEKEENIDDFERSSEEEPSIHHLVKAKANMLFAKSVRDRILTVDCDAKTLMNTSGNLFLSVTSTFSADTARRSSTSKRTSNREQAEASVLSAIE